MERKKNMTEKGRVLETCELQFRKKIELKLKAKRCNWQQLTSRETLKHLPRVPDLLKN